METVVLQQERTRDRTVAPGCQAVRVGMRVCVGAGFERVRGSGEILGCIISGEKRKEILNVL